MATGKEVLDLPMGKNDADAETVRGYLKELLTKLWSEEEGFSGKRPFGNSGWSLDLKLPLIKAGFVQGSLDEDGFIDRIDHDAANQLIFDAIDALN